MLDDRRDFDGPQIEFKRPKPNGRQEATIASDALATIEKSLPASWRKPKSEEARFLAFRDLPEEDKLELLAYCIALALQPKLGAAEGDEATAYDAALALTEASVADYWRPTRENFLEPPHTRSASCHWTRHAWRPVGAIAGKRQESRSG